MFLPLVIPSECLGRLREDAAGAYYGFVYTRLKSRAKTLVARRQAGGLQGSLSC